MSFWAFWALGSVKNVPGVLFGVGCTIFRHFWWTERQQVKPKNAFHANKLIPNSELLMIENMGHLIEEPVFNKFKGELIQHLDKNC